MKKLFLSTALPYVNSKPHLGFALELIQADTISRYHRLLGEDIFFLTGTDENSLKNVKAAEKQGASVKKYVDKQANNFKDLKQVLNLSWNDFIRTTEQRHIKGSQKLWRACSKDIYFGEYKGFYCTGCETYYKDRELKDNYCQEHQNPLELIKEPAYFFKLSKYASQIKDLIEKGKNSGIEVIPDGRKNEVLSFIDQGLEDICISRSNKRAKGWGIDVPDAQGQKIWCWFDALSNYITALGYADEDKSFKEYWQKNENILHVIGKGISRFHAIYWIGILLSAGLNLPKTIFVHGYITSGGQKMSKSLGNVVDPFELVEKYGTDPVRYFLLREISPTEDGDYTCQKFEERYNADLASGLGNLLARVITLANKFQVPVSNKFSNPNFQTFINKIKKDYKNSLETFKFNEALATIWQLIGFCDKYIEQEKPWEAKQSDKQVVSDLLFALNEITNLLKPFLPETSERILKQLKNGKSEPLFPRLLC